MKQTDYAYGVAYLRALENKLLDKNDLEGLITAKSADFALRQLTDKGYGELTVSDFEQGLSRQEAACWKIVREVAPKNAPLNLLLLENDFHNLKAALKALFAGRESVSDLFITGTADVTLLQNAVFQKNFSDLPDFLKQAAQQGYDLLAATHDGQRLDIFLDKCAMDCMMQEAKKAGSLFIEGFVALKNALADIKIAYRALKTDKDVTFLDNALSAHSQIPREGLMQAFADGEEALLQFISQNGFAKGTEALKQGMTAYEQYADSRVLAYTDEARYITMGVEPMLAYILKKQAEIAAVRCIISCKINDFSEDEIRERVR